LSIDDWRLKIERNRFSMKHMSYLQFLYPQEGQLRKIKKSPIQRSTILNQQSTIINHQSKNVDHR